MTHHVVSQKGCASGIRVETNIDRDRSLQFKRLERCTASCLAEPTWLINYLCGVQQGQALVSQICDVLKPSIKIVEAARKATDHQPAGDLCRHDNVLSQPNRDSYAEADLRAHGWNVTEVDVQASLHVFAVQLCRQQRVLDGKSLVIVYDLGLTKDHERGGEIQALTTHLVRRDSEVAGGAVANVPDDNSQRKRLCRFYFRSERIVAPDLSVPVIVDFEEGVGKHLISPVNARTNETVAKRHLDGVWPQVHRNELAVRIVRQSSRDLVEH